MSFEIVQNNEIKLFVTLKTIDWLIDENNAYAYIFNPILMEGYQRKIDDSHVEKIVDYLLESVNENTFSMPTAIICARNNQSEMKLRIVDGQHRIHAFRLFKHLYNDKYQQISNKEIPVTIMTINSKREDIEVDTFITINKTSKKVDTSLALILKNKYLALKHEVYNPISLKCEYLSVELAKLLNDNPNSIWKNKISYEGLPKNEGKLISLISFVNSMRTVISKLHRFNLINLNWNDTDNRPETITQNLSDVFNKIWNEIKLKFSILYTNKEDSIIQSAIGFSSFNIFIKDKIIENSLNLEEFVDKFKNKLKSMKINYDDWRPSGPFSKNSSAAGFKYVADQLSKY